MTNFERITKSPEVLAKRTAFFVITAFNTVLKSYGQNPLGNSEKERLTKEHLNWLNQEAKESEGRMSELKPCPFCGNAVKVAISYGYSVCNYKYWNGGVTCKCGNKLSSPRFMNSRKEVKEFLVTRWNSRPIEDALRARIKELEEALSIKNNEKCNTK